MAPDSDCSGLGGLPGGGTSQLKRGNWPKWAVGVVVECVCACVCIRAHVCTEQLVGGRLPNLSRPQPCSLSCDTPPQANNDPMSVRPSAKYLGPPASRAAPVGPSTPLSPSLLLCRGAPGSHTQHRDLSPSWAHGGGREAGQWPLRGFQGLAQLADGPGPDRTVMAWLRAVWPGDPTWKEAESLPLDPRDLGLSADWRISGPHGPVPRSERASVLRARSSRRPGSSTPHPGQACFPPQP